MLRPGETAKGFIEPDEQLRQEMAGNRSTLTQLLREEVRTARGITRIRATFELTLFELLTKPRFMRRSASW
ncbi:hypothetical protein [Frankia sp. QA3]|uniref:hypothetical protein n=1 Tax=Frankia sp. QA3 TaxID=710111 RepID=UPI000269B9C9|nr:hypothetical protein [Frankia sp. QA3]EIV90842.1 hypothetical protein FraQA3DRAFT_0250 [Frankia sp. QA3]